MLAIALSLLFGLIAFAALAQVFVSVGAGLRHGRAVLTELSRQERVTARAKSLRPRARPHWPELAAA